MSTPATVSNSDGSSQTLYVQAASEHVGGQVRTCLVALAQLGQMMAAIDPDEYRSHAGKFDGAIKSSIEASAINVLGRMDRLFGNDQLWPTESLEAQNAATIKQYSELRIQRAEEELKEAKHRNRPCVRCAARLTLVGGRYYVSIGDTSDPTTSVVGSGLTVEEAMQNFDNQAQQAMPPAS